ncbi:MAG: Protein archease [Methanobacteriota archaeon]|nr:MAG: Protein archease [Euryarchaeota archaeon]
MSSWAFGTTADVGMRCYSNSENRLLEEAVAGMQSILLSTKGIESLKKLTRDTGSFILTTDTDEWTSILVLLLEEVLFRAEAKDEWICDLQVITELTDNQKIIANVQYSKVNTDNLELEIEIKAVTLHELAFAFVPEGALLPSKWPEVPSFEGPGWYCDVVFDI